MFHSFLSSYNALTFILNSFVSGLVFLCVLSQLLAQPMAVPGVEAYTALISGHASLGNVEEAFRILDRMYERNIHPNIFTLTSLMKTCVMREDWGRARELLAMGDRYLSPQNVDNNGANRDGNTAGVDNSRSNGLVLVNQLATLRGSLVIGLCQMSMSPDIGDYYPR